MPGVTTSLAKVANDVIAVMIVAKTTAGLFGWRLFRRMRQVSVEARASLRKLRSRLEMRMKRACPRAWNDIGTFPQKRGAATGCVDRAAHGVSAFGQARRCENSLCTARYGRVGIKKIVL